MPELYPRQKGEENSAIKKELEVRGSALHELPGHTHNPFSAFCFRPDNVRFETQDEGEKIILLLRQHPIVNIPWILTAILLIFAPLILNYFPILDFLPLRFQIVSLIFWYLIVAAFIIQSFLTWFFNVYIVTDERVIDVDFINLIYKEVSDAKISNIQEVSHTIGGVVGTLFNFGHIKIQTASAVPTFDFENVLDPSQVVRILNELRVEEEQEALEGRVR